MSEDSDSAIQADSLDSLNADSSWLVTFRRQNRKAFHLIVDPWLLGSQIDYVPFFSRQSHVIPPSHDSLTQLEEQLDIEISAILLSHEFTDHCHEATLRTARTDMSIFAHPYAKSRLDKWKIFEKPANAFRIWKAKDNRDVPDRLQDLSSSPVDHELAEDLSLLYVPTDNSFDPAGNRLHGLTVITFQDDGHLYSILYSPHGLPSTSLNKVVDALDGEQNHQCLALIQSWDHIKIPIMGDVNLGKEHGRQVVERIKPNYWIRTHELKTKEGLIGKVLKRNRENVHSVQQVVAQHVKVLELESGQSLKLL